MSEPTTKLWIEALRKFEEHWKRDNLPLTSTQVSDGDSVLSTGACACCVLAGQNKWWSDEKCGLCPLPDCCPDDNKGVYFAVAVVRSELLTGAKKPSGAQTLRWRAACRKMIALIRKTRKRLEREVGEENTR